MATTTATPYSFTEKKRIRKSFAKRASVLPVPFLLETQLASYRAFLQADTPREARKNEGLQAAFTSIFPISSHSGNARLEFVELLAAAAGVRRRRVPAARPDVLLGAARQGPPDHHGQGSAEGHGQGSEGAGGLHGRDSAHDGQRLVHHQRHRARHRLAAPPLAGRVLRARPRQDALVRQAPVLGPRDSLPRLVARLRVRSEGLPVLPRRPPPQDAGDDAAEGDRPHQRGHPQAVLRVRHVPPVGARAPSSSSCPSACAARWRASTSSARTARSSSPKDKRITARHVRELVDGGVKRIAVPSDYIVGRTLATNVVDTTTGEVLAKANDEITDELLRKAASTPASPRSRRSTPTTSTRGRTSRRRCAPTTRRTSTRPRSRSTG